ncbi:MAG: HAD-IA family hydrolase [Proteobacteria bacterium]|nr:HAD-IA family hydrolase [Pseudomonadota bacterium]
MRATAPLRLAVFDCDGTLVDSQHAIAAAVSAAWAASAATRGLPPPGPGEVRRVVGLPLEEAIARLFPAGSAADVAALTGLYKLAFAERRHAPDYDEPLFAGALDALAEIERAGVLLGIATGKSRRGLLATLERHGLERRFAVLKTADDGPGKPNPHLLLAAMAETGVEAAATAMIGDTTFDIVMARGAGCAAIGVAWGYHPPAELRAAGAHAVVDRYPDLPMVVANVVSPVHNGHGAG